MNALPFRPDHKLTDFLAKNPFTLSAEIIPPRNGSEQAQVITLISELTQAGAQFLAVTKGAGGSLRGGSLPIAQVIKEHFNVPCIAHFTCRDLTREDVENQLMDHHYFGIRNILALRGDPPDGQPHWKAREGGYNYAHELISQIQNLNRGQYLVRPNGPKATAQGATDFCIGAAVYPEFPDEKLRIEYFKQKVEAGAQFGITDMLFDPEAYARFMDSCAKNRLSIPVLPGTRILKSRGQAQKMCQKFKVQIPATMLAQLPEEDSPEGNQLGVEIFLRLVDRLKSLGAPGIHLFVIADSTGAKAGLRSLSPGLPSSTALS